MIMNTRDKEITDQPRLNHFDLKSNSTCNIYLPNNFSFSTVSVDEESTGDDPVAENQRTTVSVRNKHTRILYSANSLQQNYPEFFLTCFL